MLNSSKTFLYCFCTSQFLCTIPETFSVHKCLLGQSLKNFVILCFYNCVENSRNFETISLLGFTKSFLALIWLCAGNLAGSYFIKSESVIKKQVMAPVFKVVFTYSEILDFIKICQDTKCNLSKVISILFESWSRVLTGRGSRE